MRIRDPGWKKFGSGFRDNTGDSFSPPYISADTFNDDIAIYSPPLSLSFVPRNENFNSLSSLF
jgi:hypothetical protein